MVTKAHGDNGEIRSISEQLPRYSSSIQHKKTQTYVFNFAYSNSRNKLKRHCEYFWSPQNKDISFQVKHYSLLNKSKYPLTIEVRLSWVLYLSRGTPQELFLSDNQKFHVENLTWKIACSSTEITNWWKKFELERYLSLQEKLECFLVWYIKNWICERATIILIDKIKLFLWTIIINCLVLCINFRTFFTHVEY